MTHTEQTEMFQKIIFKKFRMIYFHKFHTTTHLFSFHDRIKLNADFEMIDAHTLA